MVAMLEAPNRCSRRHQERPPSQARSPGLPREVEEKVEEKQVGARQYTTLPTQEHSA